jgi:hypothetical protein
MEVVDQRIGVIKTSVSNPDTERIFLCLKKLNIARRARSKAVKMGYDARQSSAEVLSRPVWRGAALTAGQAVMVETMRSGDRHQRSLEIATRCHPGCRGEQSFLFVEPNGFQIYVGALRELASRQSLHVVRINPVGSYRVKRGLL